jgi:hypothetical protein
VVRVHRLGRVAQTLQGLGVPSKDFALYLVSQRLLKWFRQQAVIAWVKLKCELSLNDCQTLQSQP